MMNKITLTFTAEQLGILNDALIEMPFKKVVYLINDINEQVKTQTQKPAEELSANDLGYARSGSGVLP